MKIQEKLQGTINTIVGDVQQNVEVAKGQATAAYSEIVSAAKEEIELQKNSFNTYKERFEALKAKGFNKSEVVEDVKGEVAFFSNELVSTVNRNFSTLKSIVAPKFEEVKKSVVKATKGTSAKAEKAATAVKSEVKKEVKKATKATKEAVSETAKTVNKIVDEVAAEVK